MKIILIYYLFDLILKCKRLSLLDYVFNLGTPGIVDLSAFLVELIKIRCILNM